MSLTNWNTAGSKTGASKTASFFESIRESPNKKGPGREPLVAGVFRNRWIQYDEPANKNIWGLLNIRKKIWKFWSWDLHEYRVTHLQTFEFRGEPIELSCIFSGQAGYLLWLVFSSPCRSIPCSVVSMSSGGSHLAVARHGDLHLVCGLVRLRLLLWPFRHRRGVALHAASVRARDGRRRKRRRDGGVVAVWHGVTMSNLPK